MLREYILGGGGGGGGVWPNVGRCGRRNTLLLKEQGGERRLWDDTLEGAFC